METNPFVSAPGAQPPILVGRSAEFAAMENAALATAAGQPHEPVILVGLRGMGKTTLLQEALRLLPGRPVVLSIEAKKNEPLAQTLAETLQRASAEVASMPERIRQKINALADALPRPTVEVENVGKFALAAPIDAPLASFTQRLREVHRAISDAGRYMVIAIDEIQDGSSGDLSHLIAFIHETAQGSAGHPALLLGAGLPNAPRHLFDVRTYTERWAYLRVRLLCDDDVRVGITGPLNERNVTIDEEATEVIVDEAGGYPFFLQRFAAAAWNAKLERRITVDRARSAVTGVRRLLDEQMYGARFEILTPREVRYCLALADLGPGMHRSGDVAMQLGLDSSNRIGSIRSSLIRKEVVFAPVEGAIEFRIPLTERYIMRNRAILEQRSTQNPLTP